MSTKVSPPIKKLVVIEEGVLITMAHNKLFLAEFPFLKSLASYGASAQSCNTCNQQANHQKATVFTAAKATLASMSDDKKRILKSLLNAAQIRLMYKVGNKVVQYTC